MEFDFIWQVIKVCWIGFCALWGIGILWVMLTRRLQERSGYVVECSFGREPEDSAIITYEEKGESIMFTANRNDLIVKIPSERLWHESMHPWAKTRRDEIVERVKQRTNKSRFIFQEHDNEQDVNSLYCSNYGVTGERKLDRVI